MDWWYFLLSIYFVTAAADIPRVHTLNVQQDERIRLECIVTTKQDAEEVRLMNSPDVHIPIRFSLSRPCGYASDRLTIPTC